MLVAIGVVASFIIMMLPPTSGRKAVRQRTASSITALSNVYGFLISTWITNRADEKVAHIPAKWSRDFRTRLLGIAQEINTIRELTDLAKWEGGIRGAWPSEEYTRLGDVQIEMVSALAQVGHVDHCLNSQLNLDDNSSVEPLGISRTIGGLLSFIARKS